MFTNDPIQYYTRHTYGQERMYLVQNEAGKIVSACLFSLNQHTSMTADDKKVLEKLGLTFLEVLPPKSTKK
jgi:hypothetical protein